MTTKVIIECQENSHKDVKVALLHAKTKGPYGYPTRLKAGEKKEFYVWDNQSLLVEEIEKQDDNTAETKEQAPSQ